MPDTWIEEILGSAGGDALFFTAKNIAAGLLKQVLHHTGEKVSGHVATAVQDWATTTFGLASADERCYRQAKDAMDPNIRVLLSKRLEDLNDATDAQLSRERYNWFRMTVMSDDVNEIVTALTNYATMSPAQWTRECTEMDYKRERTKNVAMEFLGKHLTNFKDGVKLFYSRANANIEAHPLSAELKDMGDAAMERLRNARWR